MADTVNTNVLVNGKTRKVIQIQNVSDGTGESAVIKANVSDEGVTTNQNTVTHYSIQEIEYAIQGFTYVKLDFDATTNDEAAVLPTGSGYKDFRGVGGLRDPQSTGSTGDIVLTTGGAASGATYDITLHLKKHV